MSITIKQLTATDASLLISAGEIFSDKKISQSWAIKYLSNPDNFYYLAYFENEIAGFVCGNYIDIWQKEFKEIFVYDMEVLEIYRRKGIAKSLLQKAAQDGNLLGHKDPWVLTEQDNIPAKALYGLYGGESKINILFDLSEFAKIDSSAH